MPAPLLFEAWSNTFIFLTTIVGLIAAIGIIAKSFSIMLINGWMAFTALALKTGYDLYITIFIVATIIAGIGLVFNIWKEVFGNNGGAPA